MTDTAGALLERDAAAPAVRWATRPRRRRRRLAAGFGALAFVALVLALADAVAQVNADGAPLVGRFFAAAVQPRLDVAFLEVVASAALTTASYAALGTAVALAFGLAAAPLLARAGWEAGGRRPPRAVRVGWVVARGGLAVPRGVHEVVWALVLLSILGLDPLVAVLAIGLPYGAVTAKVIADLLDEAPREPMTALLAAGARRPTAVLVGLVPAALGDIATYAFYRLECALRAAAILGIVGAGGLGFQLALSFQALRYDEMWTIIAALVVLAALVEGWSAVVRHRLAGHRRPARRARAAGTRRGRDPVVAGSLLGAALMVAGSAWWLGVDASTVWSERTMSLLADAVAAAWPPDFAAAGGTSLVAQAATTVAMAVLGTAIAFVLAMVLVVPAAAALRLRAGGRVLRSVLRAPLLVLRAVPPPVWAFVFVLVLLPGVLPGALAIAVYNLGVLGRLLAEAVEEADERPLRALQALGASKATIVVTALVPAAFGRFATHGLERWETAMRDTVVVGLVGAGGLGVVLDAQLQTFALGAASATLLILLALTFAVDLAGTWLRRAVR